MKQWWKYYKLREEPLLSPDPLVDPEDLKLFFGREDDIEFVKTLTQGQSGSALLITGSPGVGKTSFVHKLLAKEKGFIRANLSSASTIHDADVEIAQSCLLALKRINKTEATRLRRRLLSRTSETTGRNIQGILAPGGFGGSTTSIYQKTMAPIRNIEVRDVIRESLDALSSKKCRIHLFLDESDFFDEENAAELTHLCRRIKELLPLGSIMIFANRDLKNQLSDEYHDPQTLVRSTFRHHYRLDTLWEPGKADVPKLLGKRMQRGNPLAAYNFPISQDACCVLDVLSGGNFKLFLQYVETSLMHGAIHQEKIPLKEAFVRNLITTQFDEAKIRGEDESAVLLHLRSTPSHVSDRSFQKILGSRTKLQDVLGQLEQRGLVRRNTRRSGVKQIYSVTEKGEMLLDDSNSETATKDK